MLEDTLSIHNRLLSVLQPLDITLNEFQILIQIQNDPTLSAFAISKNLHMNPSDVRRSISALEKKEILRGKIVYTDPILGDRELSSIELIYDPIPLGLQRQHLVFFNIKNMLCLKYLEAFFEIHPYTHFRSVAIGNGLHLYVQLDLPLKATKFVESVIIKLQQLDYFDSSFHFIADHYAKSNFNMVQWLQLHNKFKSIKNLNPNHLFSQRSLFTDLYYNFQENEPNIINKRSGLDIQIMNFDKMDIDLIRELSINAQIQKKDLGVIYDKDISTISKRIKSINSKFSRGHLLRFNSNYFNQNSHQLLIGKLPLNFLPEQLHNFVLSNNIPFKTDLLISNKTFIWSLVSPHSYAIEIQRFLWDIGCTVNNYQLNINSAKTYFIDSTNLDNNNKWIVSKDYVETNPISQLIKIINN